MLPVFLSWLLLVILHIIYILYIHTYITPFPLDVCFTPLLMTSWTIACLQDQECPSIHNPAALPLPCWFVHPVVLAKPLASFPTLSCEVRTKTSSMFGMIETLQLACVFDALSRNKTFSQFSNVLLLNHWTFGGLYTSLVLVQGTFRNVDLEHKMLILFCCCWLVTVFCLLA